MSSIETCVALLFSSAVKTRVTMASAFAKLRFAKPAKTVSLFSLINCTCNMFSKNYEMQIYNL